MNLRMKPAVRVHLPAQNGTRAPWFQVSLSTGLAMMLIGGLLVPTLIAAWTDGGFGMMLLIVINLLLVVAMIGEYLIRNGRRRWSDPPHGQ